MLTEKDYCDYETRNELIKLGYPAYLYDNTEVDKILGAILLYEAQKWLREEKDMFIEVIHTNLLGKDYFNVHLSNTDCAFQSIFGKSSYEEALSEGIKEAVKILKEE